MIPLFMFKVYGFNLKRDRDVRPDADAFPADLGCILGGLPAAAVPALVCVNLIVSRKMVVTLGAVLMIARG